MNNNVALLVLTTMLPEEYTLPGTERKITIDNGNSQTGGRQRRFDMRWHIIRSFLSMCIQCIMFWNQAVEPGLKITSSRGVVVFLDEQACRRMPDKQCTKTFVPIGRSNGL